MVSVHRIGFVAEQIAEVLHLSDRCDVRSCFSLLTGDVTRHVLANGCISESFYLIL